MMQLRPYQQECVDAIQGGWAEYNSQLMVLPTGTGKTICFAEIADREVKAGNTVMVLAHRDELLEQARDKLVQARELDTALEKGSTHAAGSFTPVVVASVQTLHAKRLEREWRQNDVDLLIVDEAHHCLADSYRRVLDHFENARVLGVTATPDRGDKKSLAKVFENIPYQYSLRQAVKEGYLCPLQARLLPLKIDLSSVRIRQGDFDVNDVADRVAPFLQAAAQELAKNARDRKTLVFLPLIRLSEAFAEYCRDLGLDARHVSGESHDRKQIVQDFHDNKSRVLCNSSLLLEGFDCPDIDCICSLRPTKSRALYAQMIGRGTRIAPGKQDLLILDFLWESTKHDLCVPASLIAKDSAQAKQIMQFVAPNKTLMDAERDAQAEREKLLAQRLAAQTHKKTRTIDPLQFALSIHDVDLEEYEPTMGWECSSPTDKQLAVLEKRGFNPDDITSKGLASKIIDKLFQRQHLGLCTPKQARLLARYGYDPTNITFEEASSRIDVISKTWRKSA